MRILCRTILAAALAVVTVFGDTVEEREKRTDEIAQWLPAEPKADGARIGDRAAWGRLAAMPEAKDEAARHFVLRHPNGGRSLALDVESSAPIVFRDEKIENPGFPTITRLGFSFAEPVTTASLKMTFKFGGGRTP